MKHCLLFAIRWLSCSFGLWLTVKLFGNTTLHNPVATVAMFMLAGLVFSLINSVLKPILTTLSLPFMIVTMGLFTIILNGLMVWLTIALIPTMSMNFTPAIISSLVISMLNYIINSLTPVRLSEEDNETK